MARNPFWLSFICLMTLSVIGYTTYMLVKVWQYARLDQHIEAQQIQWSILSPHEESFIPFANYSFRLQGNIYQGHTQWHESFLNEWTAQEAIARLQRSSPEVWFDSSSPSISSLQKHFPLKESLYSILLWALALYFLGLGYYVNRRLL